MKLPKPVIKYYEHGNVEVKNIPSGLIYLD